MKEEVKGLLKSRTVWGVIIMIAGSLLGWSTEVQTEITDSAMLIVSAVLEAGGAALAIYGRVKATKTIQGAV